VQFAIDEDSPYDLVKDIVRYRLEANKAKAAAVRTANCMR